MSYLYRLLYPNFAAIINSKTFLGILYKNSYNDSYDEFFKLSGNNHLTRKLKNLFPLFPWHDGIDKRSVNYKAIHEGRKKSCYISRFSEVNAKFAGEYCIHNHRYFECIKYVSNFWNKRTLKVWNPFWLSYSITNFIQYDQIGF